MSAPDVKMAHELMSIVRAEMRSLAHMGDAADFPDAIFGFHAQQIAEKALKAWIALQGEVFPLTHDLARLVAVLEKAGVDMSAHDAVPDLTAYAVALRYTSSSWAASEMERRDVVAVLKRLTTAVEQGLAATQPPGASD